MKIQEMMEADRLKRGINYWIFACVFSFFCPMYGQNSYTIGVNNSVLVGPNSFAKPIVGGDTLFVDPLRTKAISFTNLVGLPDKPIVIINGNGQVKITDPSILVGLNFSNCKYVKLSGKGNANYKYGFKIWAPFSGISLSELSSDIEIENVEINHQGFVGIMAKKDFKGNPPVPVPVFKNLSIHDNLIANVEEGMYLGETTSPGMEFKHVRIYNNYLIHCGREGVQIANMPEDVSIFNNVFYNSGVLQKQFHGNNLQIGDNSVAKVYNNIFTKASEYGIIAFGMGNIEVYNNYFTENKGVFIANRKFSLPLAPITFRDNYFVNLTGSSVVWCYNDINNQYFTNNRWNDGILFIQYGIANAKQKTILQNNVQGAISALNFVNASTNNFALSPVNIAQYLQLGPQPSAFRAFNSVPTFQPLADIYTDWFKTARRELIATVEDGDNLIFEIDSLKDFVMIEQKDGKTYLKVIAIPYSQKLNQLTVKVRDASHSDYAYQQLSIAIKNPANAMPAKIGIADYNLGILDRDSILLAKQDSDGDLLQYQLLDNPSFVKINWIDNNPYLMITPGYHDIGLYNNIRIMYSDWYNYAQYDTFSIKVNYKLPKKLQPIVRINCGGPEIADGMLWWSNNYRIKSPFENSVHYTSGNHTWSGDNKTGVPSNIFGPFAYANGMSDSLMWSFPFENGSYIVNLYFAEQPANVISGKTSIVNISLQNKLVETGFSPYVTNGINAVKKSYPVFVNNGQLDLEIEAKQGVAMLNGIEIRYVDNNTAIKKVGEERNSFKAYLIKQTNTEIQIATNLAFNTISSFSIIDLMGRKTNCKVYEKSAADAKISFMVDCKNLIGGIYFLRILQKTGNYEVVRFAIP